MAHKWLLQTRASLGLLRFAPEANESSGPGQHLQDASAENKEWRIWPKIRFSAVVKIQVTWNLETLHCDAWRLGK